MRCKNCAEEIKADWTNCPKCGANLKLGRYSSEDDPTERLTKVEGELKKVKDHLEEEHAKKLEKPSGRKTLFGD